MQYYPPDLANLVEQFDRLPGVRGKSAQQLPLHDHPPPHEHAHAIAQALHSAQSPIHCTPVWTNLT